MAFFVKRKFPKCRLYRIAEVYLEEGGEPGGAGCADHGHHQQVVQHPRATQQLQPVHTPIVTEKLYR